MNSSSRCGARRSRGIVEELHAHVPELANAESTARTVEGRQKQTTR